VFKVKVLAWIFIILLVSAAVGLYLLNSAYNDMLKPVNPEAVDVYLIIEIPQGANTEAIADILYNEGLIQNQLAFRFYVRRYDLGQGFIAGRYRLSPSFSMEQIILKIQAGEVYSETSWFTIPEGLRIEEIAARLEQNGLVNRDRFLDLARQPSPDLIETYPFLAKVNNSGITYVLEGYLFPDTYEVNPQVSEGEIITIMLRQMDFVLNSLDYSDRLAELGISLHDMLTIASLIEREARVDHERAMVASVIYNRLAINMSLQIDATIQYILDEPKEFLLYADLEIPSPYNTYLNNGLPPGPIAAPGKESVKAALNPAVSDYYYYNYKYDDTGEHYFSKTYEEHLANVAKAESNLP
jgi:UPF0755 protein